jgi:hypothetical protein
MIRGSRIALAVCLTSTALLLSPIETNAQTQRLDFDRPEAWALKRFTSATLIGGLAEPWKQRSGAVSFGIELGWLPELDREQLRVGFSGRKEEDLNKVPIVVRPRVTVGLPGRFSVDFAATAPFRVFGVRPRLFALAVQRPIFERDRWSLGWRAYGQLGSVTGAFSCPQKVLDFPPGSASNPAGCVAESADKASLRYAGGELQFAHKVPWVRGLTAHVTGGGNLIDSKYQVHAPRVGRLDQTRLRARGPTFSTNAGIAYALTSRVALAIDAFYTPLWVTRSADTPRQNDGLFNVRALLSYRLR